MGRIGRMLLGYPGGLLYQVRTPFSVRSRREKYAFFLREMHPSETDSILDIGVCDDGDLYAANFLESWYPHRECITACGVEDLAAYRKTFPDVRTLRADGRLLPFRDRQFRIVFANAVIEHVGKRAEQERFIAEMCRVGDMVFCTTPAKEFPIEPHTFVPFAHWLPMSARNFIYRALGSRIWATEDRLRPLSARQLLAMFAKAGRPAHLLRTRLLGMTASLIAIVD